jgi:hypothetical protein
MSLPPLDYETPTRPGVVRLMHQTRFWLTILALSVPGAGASVYVWARAVLALPTPYSYRDEWFEGQPMALAWVCALGWLGRIPFAFTGLCGLIVAERRPRLVMLSALVIAVSMGMYVFDAVTGFWQYAF